MFIDAVKWGFQNEVTYGHYENINTIADLAEHMKEWWAENVLADSDFHDWLNDRRSKLKKGQEIDAEIMYVYDLETELWGPDHKKYSKFSLPDRSEGLALEPFRFVLLFYMYERSLRYLLLKLGYIRLSDTNSHSSLRNRSYDLFFAHEHQGLGRWMPYPFNLTALTNRIDHGHHDTDRHRRYSFKGEHFSVVKKSHYADVIESALRQATKWLRRRNGGKRSKPKPGTIKAFIFDGLWHYSESYRYRVPLASEYARKHPFYWNLNSRWIGYFWLGLLELLLFSLAPRRMKDLWENYQSLPKSPVTRDIQSTRWEIISGLRELLMEL